LDIQDIDHALHTQIVDPAAQEPEMSGQDA